MILCGLGTWQAGKYLDKISGREAALCQSEQSRIIRDSFLNLHQIPQIKCPDLVVLEGDIADNITVPVGPRVNEGQVGYYLYAPMRAKDGSHIFINFGWSPNTQLQLANFQNIQVSGAFLPPPTGNMFSPENLPEKDEWFYMDIDKAAQFYEMNRIAPFIVYAQNIKPEIIRNFMPAELSKTYLTPQTHLQYAAFWYFMALAMIGVFILRFVWRGKQS